MPIKSLNNEPELLLQIAAGNQEAFTELFDKYRNRVYTIAMRFVKIGHLAEEIVQDVFLKIWVKRSELTKIDQFEAYLHTVVRHQAYKALKKSARYHDIVQGSSDITAILEQDVHELLRQKELTSMLQEAVKALPPQQQQVFQLSRQEGLKRNEIAARLGLSPETIKVHLTLATRSIRAYCLARIDYCILWGLLVSVIFFSFY